MRQIKNTPNLKKETQIREELNRLDIIPYIQEKCVDVQIIYGFGSWFLGEENQNSDIDFAILTKNPVKPMDRWDLQNGLAEQLRRNVDIVSLLTASTVLRLEVVAHGISLFVEDSNSKDIFETMVFSSYARLNEERAGILSDIYERSSVYG